ncbi:LuxR C-terminal-related transcriptional regulator [Longibaculum muris]|uniref:response regulator transcription factor n=1 Tax=Longibaculum muris TaxID=1796628 RepID=UPI0029439DCC|nr:LuxR C-terminal-related transcriptional regulator [Longibaculum muris]
MKENIVHLIKQNEKQTNETLAKLCLWILLFEIIICLLSLFHIFDVPDQLLRNTFFMTLIPLLLPTFFIHIIHYHQENLKYIILFVLTFVVSTFYCFFTFQSIMLFVIPMILSIFYFDQTLFKTSYFIGMLGLLIAHVITSFYIPQSIIEPFTNPYMIMVYGALPRMLQYSLISFLLYILKKHYLHLFDNLLQYQPTSFIKDPIIEKQLNELTNREKDILVLMVQGCTNLQISQQLCLSMGTVKNYVSKIYEKLETHDRTYIVLKYSDYFKDCDSSHSSK